jgi:serine/threonine-protein kinase
MVMEFVRGETFDKVSSRLGPLPVERAARLCAQVLDALAYAHRAGIVHRDLKPANLMLTESGLAKVMDFGIARMIGTEHLTLDGFMVGTPAYMAPEQALGGEIDGRTDLYAMGVVFYRLLTAHLPFKADSGVAMVHKQIHDLPTPLRQFRADLPAVCQDILTRAMAKTPAERYQTAEEFRDALAALAGIGAADVTATRPISTQQLSPDLEKTLSPMPTPVFTAQPPIADPDAIATMRLEVAAAAPTLALAAAPTVALAATPAAAPTLAPAAAPALAPPAAPAASSSPDRRRAAVAVVALLLVGVVTTAIVMWRANGREAGADLAARDGVPVVSTPATAPPVTPPANPAPAPAGAAPIAATPPPAAASNAAPRPKRDDAAAKADAAPQREASAPPAAAPAAAPTAPPPARGDVPIVTFANLRLLVTQDGKASDREASLRLGSDGLQVVDGAQTLHSAAYEDVIGLFHSHSREPRWATPAGTSVPVAKAGGKFSFLKGAPDWVTVRTKNVFIPLRVPGDDLDRVVAALEARTGTRIVRAR